MKKVNFKLIFMPLALNSDILLTDMFSYTPVHGWQFMNLQLHETFSTLRKFQFKSQISKFMGLFALARQPSSGPGPGERLHTYSLAHAATGTGNFRSTYYKFHSLDYVCKL